MSSGIFCSLPALFLLSVPLLAQPADIAKTSPRISRYEDGRQSRSLTKEEQRRGFALSSRHWMFPVPGNSVPREDADEIPVLSIFAARGEYEPAVFTVHAARDIGNVTVDVKDLTSANGERILADDLEVYCVRYLTRRLGTDGSEIVRGFPSFLEKTRRVSMRAGEAVRFWLIVNVPGQTERGLYSGGISVSSDDGKAELQLNVDVMPFELPQSRARHTVCFGRNSYERISVSKGFPYAFQDLAAHGVTGVAVGGPRLREMEVDGPSVRFELSGNFAYEDCMRALRASGIPGPIIVADSVQAFGALKTTAVGPDTRIKLFMMGHHSDIWNDPANMVRFNPDFAALYANGLAALTEKHEREGWPPFWIIPRYGPLTAAESTDSPLRQLLGFLADSDKVRTGIFLDQDGGEVIIPHGITDTVILTGGVRDRNTVLQMHQAGISVMISGIDADVLNPETIRYAAGYYMWINGLDGMLALDYQSVRVSAYNDLDGEESDRIFRYPPEGGENGGPSVSLEALREGIDDYRYLQALSETIEWARSSNDRNLAKRGTRAERELQKKLEGLEHLRDLRNAAQWPAAQISEDGGTIYDGQIKLPVDLEFQDYDGIRRWAAEQIIELEFAD